MGLSEHALGLALFGFSESKPEDQDVQEAVSEYYQYLITLIFLKTASGPHFRNEVPS